MIFEKLKALLQCYAGTNEPAPIAAGITHYNMFNEECGAGGWHSDCNCGLFNCDCNCDCHSDCDDDDDDEYDKYDSVDDSDTVDCSW